jgi:thiamine kinase-like enzyme
VFDWVEGRSVKQDEIGIDHCRKIGSVLADIHHTDFQELRIEPEETEVRPSVDWNAYLKKGQVMEAEWVKSFEDIIENLYEWDALAREAETRFGNDRVMSHRDLDPKNVMWVQGEPVVIDWESAGFIHPMHDLIETALYWSGTSDQDRFSAFISGYKGEIAAITSDWEAVLANGFSGKLGWLEYNLKRALWLECTDEEEQRLGTRQVSETIGELREYACQIPTILKWLQEIK